METISKTVSVPKHSAELADAIGKFVAVSLINLKDGFQPGQDIPPIITSALADLLPAISNIGKIGEDAKEDGIAVGLAFALAARDVQLLIAAQAPPQA